MTSVEYEVSLEAKIRVEVVSCVEAFSGCGQ